MFGWHLGNMDIARKTSSSQDDLKFVGYEIWPKACSIALHCTVLVAFVIHLRDPTTNCDTKEEEARFVAFGWVFEIFSKFKRHIFLLNDKPHFFFLEYTKTYMCYDNNNTPSLFCSATNAHGH